MKLAFGTLPARVSAGTNREATVNISDNDLPSVTVNYQRSNYTVVEGSSVLIKVTLSADPKQRVTIPITKTHQHGASDSDYSGVPSHLSFNSGVTEKSFTFTAIDDPDDDDDESVQLAFRNLPTRNFYWHVLYRHSDDTECRSHLRGRWKVWARDEL